MVQMHTWYSGTDVGEARIRHTWFMNGTDAFHMWPIDKVNFGAARTDSWQ